MKTLRIGTLEEKPLQASKWIKSSVLLSAEEMQALIKTLEPLEFYFTGLLTQRGEGQLSVDCFLEVYANYVETLKKGEIPSHHSYSPYFSSVITHDSTALYAVPIKESAQLIRISKPVIQLQPHHVDYSSFDGKFRSMVFGSHTLSWGIQFSYPLLYQTKDSQEIIETNKTPETPNAGLFKVLQKWMRTHTIPTPFIVESSVTTVPIRLGKECLKWINRHPQFSEKGVRVRSNEDRE